MHVVTLHFMAPVRLERDFLSVAGLRMYRTRGIEEYVHRSSKRSSSSRQLPVYSPVKLSSVTTTDAVESTGQP
jgi:hypothetical protein